MNSAMSPTALDDGVTLTMSPSMSFTVRYVRLTSAQRSPRPSEMACVRKFEYCPPGISCSYTSAEPAFRPHSNGAYASRATSQ